MELHVVPGFDAEGLEFLVTIHPYNDYRHYRTISTEVQRRLLCSEIERAAEQGQVLALRIGEQVVGLATLSHLPWDSSIFGLPMAKIGFEIKNVRRRLWRWLEKIGLDGSNVLALAQS